MQRLLLKLFGIATKPFINRGLGDALWFRILAWVYRKIMRLLIPQATGIIQINGYFMNSRTSKGQIIDGLTRRLIIDGEYEPCMTRAFEQTLREGMRVIDAGANVGYYTLLAAKHVGKNGKVWAFEPEAKNFEELLSNIILNNFGEIVTSYRKALSNVEGAATMFVSDAESGEHSLIPCRTRNTKTTLVEVMRLDDIIKGKVDILKVDTEGNDMNVLLGAERILRQNKNIALFTELFPVGLKAAGQSAKDYWELLESFGFGMTLLEGKGSGKEGASFAEAIAYVKSRSNFSVNLLCSRKKK